MIFPKDQVDQLQWFAEAKEQATSTGGEQARLHL